MSFALPQHSKNKEARNKTSKRSSHGGGVNDTAISSHDSIIHLQKTIGNQAVQRLMRSKARNDAIKNGIQPKLKVSHPSEIQEQEADRIAEYITFMSPSSASPAPLKSSVNEKVNRKCESCDQEEEGGETFHRKSSDNNEHLESDDAVQDIYSMKGGGSALATSTRSFMEPLFGFDFGKVRIHTDERARRSAKSLNARAYTVGNDIMLGESTFEPNTLKGRRLLAHELTHVIQQNSDSVLQTQKVHGTIQRLDWDWGDVAQGTVASIWCCRGFNRQKPGCRNLL